MTTIPIIIRPPIKTPSFYTGHPTGMVIKSLYAFMYWAMLCSLSEGCFGIVGEDLEYYLSQTLSDAKELLRRISPPS